jgi:hypothetical protein
MRVLVHGCSPFLLVIVSEERVACRYLLWKLLLCCRNFVLYYDTTLQDEESAPWRTAAFGHPGKDKKAPERVPGLGQGRKKVRKS